MDDKEILIYIAILSIATIALIIIHAINFFYGVRFTKYLKKNNYNRWLHITTIKGLQKGGMVNPVRSLPYVFGKLDETLIDDCCSGDC